MRERGARRLPDDLTNAARFRRTGLVPTPAYGRAMPQRPRQPANVRSLPRARASRAITFQLLRFFLRAASHGKRNWNVGDSSPTRDCVYGVSPRPWTRRHLSSTTSLVHYSAVHFRTRSQHADDRATDPLAALPDHSIQERYRARLAALETISRLHHELTSGITALRKERLRSVLPAGADEVVPRLSGVVDRPLRLSAIREQLEVDIARLRRHVWRIELTHSRTHLGWEDWQELELCRTFASIHPGTRVPPKARRGAQLLRKERAVLEEVAWLAEHDSSPREPPDATPRKCPDCRNWYAGDRRLSKHRRKKHFLGDSGASEPIAERVAGDTGS